MLTQINEMERHINWADKLFDIIRVEVKEIGLIGRITNDDITKWKQWARDNEFVSK